MWEWGATMGEYGVLAKGYREAVWHHIPEGGRAALVEAMRERMVYRIEVDYQRQRVRPTLRGAVTPALRMALTLGGWSELPGSKRGDRVTWALAWME